MPGYDFFIKYQNGEYLTKSELTFATNYVCSYLNNPGRNYRYYDMYSYISKSFIVCRWKNENDYKPFAKFGEAICTDQLINFLKEKEHKNCTCSSVYYNAVI